jgi:hypothetical protein
MAIYVCHHTDRLFEVGGRDILVRRDTDHNAVTEQSLKQLEDTTMQYTLVSIPVKVLTVYPSPSRTLIASDIV